MKVKYIGPTQIGCLTHNRIYEVLSITDILYEIVDDDDDHSLWFPDSFEIVEGSVYDVDEYETID